MARAPAAEQLKILLWKSWMIIKKRPLIFLQKVLFPAFLILLFNPAQIGTKIEKPSDEQRDFETFYLNTTWTQYAMAEVFPRGDHVTYGVNWLPFSWEDTTSPKIWYSPNDGSLGADVEAVLRDLANSSTPQIPWTQFRGFSSHEELKAEFLAKPSTGWVGVAFKSSAPTWHYSIVLNGSYAPDTGGQVVEIGSPKEEHFGRYLDTGVLQIQKWIDEAIIRQAGLSAQHTPIVSAVRGSQVIKESEDVPWILQWLNGWLIGITLMFAYGSLASALAYDHEYGVTRSFLLVGVSPLVYWIHWFITMAVHFFPMSLAMTAFIFLTKLAYWSEFIYIWIWVLLALLHMVPVAITFVALVNVKVAGGIGFFGAFLGGGVYVGVIAQGSSMAVVRRIMTVINPWWGIFDGGGVLAVYDHIGRNQGITSATAWDSGFGAVLLCQLTGIILWFTAGMYVHSGALRKKPGTSDVGVKDAASEDIEPYERTDGTVVVSELRKRWGPQNSPKSVLSVDRLDFQMCKDEVFGLLGHNGAGKSTTISLLAGEFPATAGSVVYKTAEGMELKVGQDDDQIRQKIGVCLQTDPLIEIFSAREHLWMFGKLKGLDGDLDTEITARLKQCGLEEDGDKEVGNYSGGMKRKVSLAIALLGDPEVVYLDEPTAGMDPVSRRQVWDMIIEAKKGRVVVLTTHFMDEADLLSDRVAIMKKGRVIACGTSLFLKHRFGAGYTLTCSGDMNQITSVVTRICPDGSLAGQTTGEVRYALPFSDCGKLPELLSELASISQDVSIGMTTLEEVFLKTGEDNEEDENESKEELEAPLQDSFMCDVWPDVPYQRNPTAFGKVWAVARLVYLSNVRDNMSMFFGTIFPFIFIIIGWTAGSISPDSLVVPGPLRYDWEALGSGPHKVFGPGFTATDTISVGTKAQYLADVRDGGQWVGGIEAVSDGLHCTFNSSFVSSLPLLMNAHANNTLSTGNPPQGITVVLDPTEYRPFHIVDVGALLIPMLTGMGVLPLAYVVIEAIIWKFQKTSLIFKMMGVSMPQQMMAFSMYKFVFGFIPCLAANLVMAGATGNAIIKGGGRWLAFILLQMTYIGAIIPFALCLVPLFPSIRVATEIFPTILNCASIIPYLVIWIMSSSEDADTRDVGKVLGDMFCFIPPVGYQRGLAQLILLESNKGPEGVSWSDTFSWDQRVSYVIMANLITTVLCGALVHYQHTEFDLGGNRTQNPNANFSSGTAHTDVDVQELDNLANSTGDGISAKKLCKTFGKKVAVNEVSIACSQGEIFVLLGPNGAGKTTTIRMLTGDLNPSAGSIQLGGQTATDSAGFADLYGSGVCGFCPQFDGLLGPCSVLEHLRAAGAVKGMQQADIERQAKSLMAALDIAGFRDRQAEKLSGGNKRKLSMAIAIMGSPKVLFLDEPSTGMDPKARRKMWAVLKPELAGNPLDTEAGNSASRTPAILLSTHYMDEAATLASRVGIVVQGKMKATGTVTHLINRYCAKLSIEATAVHGFVTDSASEMEDKLLSKLPDGSRVLERVGGKVKIELPMEKDSTLVKDLAKNIQLMEDSKAECHVEHYSVSPMTLEQIFIDMAKTQQEEGLKKELSRVGSITGAPGL